MADRSAWLWVGAAGLGLSAFLLGRVTAPATTEVDLIELQRCQAHTASGTWHRWAQQGFPPQPDSWPGFGAQVQQPTSVG